MRWELRKLLTNRYILLLLSAALLLNGILFYRHCKDDSPGYSQAQIRQKYSQGIDIAAEIEALTERMREAQSPMDERLVTGDIFAERLLDRAVLERMEEAQGYAQFLQDVQAETRARLNSGLLEGAESVRAQERIIEIYHSLEGLVPEVSFSGGIEVFSGWYVTDLFVLLFGCVSGLVLLTQERGAGLLMLLRPTRRGKVGLYLQKFGAMCVLLLFGFAMLYGTNLAISAAVLGFGNLNRLIQSVYGFRACPIPLTVLGYLICFLGTKLLWAWTVSAVFFFLCSRTGRPAVPIVIAAGLVALALAAKNSNHLWLRASSLMYQSAVERRYQNCLLLTFFGVPVSERMVCLIFSAITGIGSSALGLALFCTGGTVPVSKRGLGRRLSCVWRHTSLLSHESYKVFVTSGAAALLLVFLLAQWGIYQSFPTRLSEYEQYYRQYSAVLSGLPTPEKDAYLQEESDRFVQIQMEIERFYAQIEDKMIAEQATRSLRDSLRPIEAFEQAKAQYEQLREGQSYVYGTGYERLFGAHGIHDDFRNLALMFLFLVMALSGMFALEEETGVAVLQTAAGAVRKVTRRKIILAGCLLVLFMLIAFVPQLAAVQRLYGLEQFCASADSVRILNGVPNGWPIWSVFAIQLLVRVLVGVGGTALILALSKKTGNTITTLLLSTAILVLPALIFMIL